MDGELAYQERLISRIDRDRKPLEDTEGGKPCRT